MHACVEWMWICQSLSHCQKSKLSVTFISSGGHNWLSGEQCNKDTVSLLNRLCRVLKYANKDQTSVFISWLLDNPWTLPSAVSIVPVMLHRSEYLNGFNTISGYLHPKHVHYKRRKSAFHVSYRATNTPVCSGKEKRMSCDSLREDRL